MQHMLSLLSIRIIHEGLCRQRYAKRPRQGGTSFMNNPDLYGRSAILLTDRCIMQHMLRPRIKVNNSFKTTYSKQQAGIDIAL